MGANPIIFMIRLNDFVIIIFPLYYKLIGYVIIFEVYYKRGMV